MSEFIIVISIGRWKAGAEITLVNQIVEPSAIGEPLKRCELFRGAQAPRSCGSSPAKTPGEIASPPLAGTGESPDAPAAQPPKSRESAAKNTGPASAFEIFIV
jgi:hypothetical protein